MSRIQMTDTIQSSLVKLCEGNPGALTVLCEIIKQGATIDPYCDPFMVVLALDTQEIYGPRIWQLYKDVCKESMVTTLGVLRARQLGFITDGQLDGAIDNYGAGLDIDDLLAKVREQLPRFSGGKESQCSVSAESRESQSGSATASPSR